MEPQPFAIGAGEPPLDLRMGASPDGNGGRQERSPGARQAEQSPAPVGDAGAADAAIRDSGGDLLCLLCRALRADLHMVSYAIGCGVPAMAAVSIYSLEGLSGLGGRLLLGLLADRLGAKRVLVAGLLVQARAIGTYLFVSRLGEFHALSVIFGIAYSGVMPLYVALAREYFGARFMGTVFGAATMATSGVSEPATATLPFPRMSSPRRRSERCCTSGRI